MANSGYTFGEKLNSVVADVACEFVVVVSVEVVDGVVSTLTVEIESVAVATGSDSVAEEISPNGTPFDEDWT